MTGFVLAQGTHQTGCMFVEFLGNEWFEIEKAMPCIVLEDRQQVAKHDKANWY